MEMLVKMAEVLVKIAVMMMARRCSGATEREGERAPLLLLP